MIVVDANRNVIVRDGCDAPSRLFALILPILTARHNDSCCESCWTEFFAKHNGSYCETQRFLLRNTMFLRVNPADSYCETQRFLLRDTTILRVKSADSYCETQRFLLRPRICIDMELIYNLSKSICASYTLDVKSTYNDMTIIYRRYEIDMTSIYEL